jgi:competence protein ComEC
MHAKILLLVAMALGEPSGLRWIDVGQGSALLAVGSSGDAILVDSGPSSGAEAIVRALQEHSVDSIALWVHTHYDADHIGGATRVLAGADGETGTADDPFVAVAWDRGVDLAPETEAVAAYFEAFAPVRASAGEGSQWTAPDMAVEVVGSGAAPSDAENERGIALCLTVGPIRVFAPGDLPASSLEAVAPACAPVDVLWASHHGAESGISDAVIDLLDPAVVVITAGRDNPHCHPSPETLGRLRDRVVWITDGAGLGPTGSCGGLAAALGPSHEVAAADLWLRVR